MAKREGLPSKLTFRYRKNGKMIDVDDDNDDEVDPLIAGVDEPTNNDDQLYGYVNE